MCLRGKPHERIESAAGKKLSHPLSVLHNARVHMKQSRTEQSNGKQGRAKERREKMEVAG
jgi:hypothetical protein